MHSALKGAGSRKELENEFNRRVPVLLYHHVGPWRPGTYRGLTVPPENFERQMRWLAHRGYTGSTPLDWLRWRGEGTGLPEKPIIITFDDAYADTAVYALPILRRYGFGAVVFVVTGRMGGTNAWDEAEGCGTLQLMTADQIRYWAGQGIEFGAHSRTHPDLTKLSVAEREAEIIGSKNDLSALLGLPVISFAYPYGEYNDAVRGLVRHEFDLGFSTEEGMNNLRSDRHLLRRICIGPNDSLVEFALFVWLNGAKRVRDHLSRFRMRIRLNSALRCISRKFSLREQSTSR